MMNKICVFLATGFEEIEALTVVDLLRRENIETRMVSVTGALTVVGSHQIPVTTDLLLEDLNFEEVTMLVLPGGGAGVENLEACESLMKQLDAFAAAKKPIAAICAAPSILAHRKILTGKKATCYPSFESHLTDAILTGESAVTDGNIITGQGMGCSIDFALAIVSYLKDHPTSAALAQKIIYHHFTQQ